MNILSLVIPGLLGPLPELKESRIELPDCIALRKWLSRGSLLQTSGEGYYSLLAELFSIDQNYSITQASAVTDQCDCSDGFWLRADPVHFKADMDHAVLIDYQQLDVLQSEADALVDSFNMHFKEDGIKLVSKHPHRWYLYSENKFDIETTRLEDAVGRNVNHFLPRGDYALKWRSFLNEAQMLFHMHEVNARREQQGKLTINSLWLWGEGLTSQLPEKSPYDWVMTNEPVAQGLAILSDCKIVPVDVELGLLLENHNHGLIILNEIMGPASYGDVQAWSETLGDLYHQWIEPLDNHLKKGLVDQIYLSSANGPVFKITKNGLRRFWKKLLPIKGFISTHA
jgi:hypothetical protein